MEQGGSIYELKELYGHSSLKMTERYLRFSSKLREGTRGRVDEVPFLGLKKRDMEQKWNKDGTNRVFG